jgi:DNA processing protein
MNADHEEQTALVALLRVRPSGLTWPDIMTEVVSTGSAVEVWNQLVQPALVPSVDDPLRVAHANIVEWLASSLTMTTVLDTNYPSQLLGIHQAPPILFARGELQPNDIAVSVVGSRDATDRGIAIADGISRNLVARGLTVMAGLALGIDTAAHKAALAEGGRTVAVIGTGINRYYPPTNQGLQDEIASSGLVLSQFWPDAPATKQSFPMRNVTMSGYGIATVVVEAGEHSGTRTQARAAVGHGRPVILTDLVFNSTKWGRELADRPGVYVASGLNEVSEIVASLRSPFDNTLMAQRAMVPTPR